MFEWALTLELEREAEPGGAGRQAARHRARPLTLGGLPLAGLPVCRSFCDLRGVHLCERLFFAFPNYLAR